MHGVIRYSSFHTDIGILGAVCTNVHLNRNIRKTVTPVVLDHARKLYENDWTLRYTVDV